MTALTFGAAAARVVRHNTSGRRTEQPVRRKSYDVGDHRAQVSRPIGDGTKNGGMAWRDAFLQVLREWSAINREDGKRKPLSANDIDVARALVFLPGLDFKTGRLEPAIDTLAAACALTRKVVVAALAKLKEYGFLGWVRRTRRRDDADGFGPQVEQVANAYYFDPRDMPRKAFLRLKELLGRKARAKSAEPTAAPAAAPRVPLDPATEAILARMEATIIEREQRSNASSQLGQNPRTSDKGDEESMS